MHDTFPYLISFVRSITKFIIDPVSVFDLNLDFFYIYIVCGDSKCETVEGESCETCPADCGKCPLKVWEISLIVVALVFFIGTISGIYGVSTVLSEFNDTYISFYSK